MREALELWDAAESEHHSVLAQRVRWASATEIRCRIPTWWPTAEESPDEHTIISAEHYPELLPLFRYGELIGPARLAVYLRVNQFMEGRVSSRLMLDWPDGRIGLHIRPRALIGALWLQFAQTIAGHRKQRQCQQCERWFEIQEDTGRPDSDGGVARAGRASRLYCSDACRSKAYRKRQSEARRLFANGATVEQIARELDSDQKTVGQWIALADQH
jgi:hypothetical protein